MGVTVYSPAGRLTNSYLALTSTLIRACTGPLNSTSAKNSVVSVVSFPDNEKVGTGVGVGVGFGFGKCCQLGVVPERVLGHLRSVLSMLTVQMFPGAIIITMERPSGDQYGV